MPAVRPPAMNANRTVGMPARAPPIIGRKSTRATHRPHSSGNGTPRICSVTNTTVPAMSEVSRLPNMYPVTCWPGRVRTPPERRAANQAKGTVMFKSLSTSLITRGILAVVIGIIALAWPSVTVLALVILFAVYAFMAAGLQAARAFSSREAGPVLGHLLRGLVDLAAGVIALAWPGPTALVLVLIVGVWAITAGLVEFSAAFASGEPAGTRVTFILGGLVTVAFGVVLCARPGLGAITLALLFGLFNLTAGTWMLVQGIELRRTGKTLQPAHSPHQEKMAA